MSIPSSLVTVANAAILKPLFAGVIAAAGEKFVMKNDNISSLYFGGAVAAGIAVSGTIGAIIEPHLPTSTNIASKLGKSLEARIIEVSTGSAAAYAVNKFVLNNEWKVDMNSILMRVGIIAGADLAAETLIDVLAHNGL